MLVVLSSCRSSVVIACPLCPCLLRHPVLVVLSSPICSLALFLCVIACPLLPPLSSLVSSASFCSRLLACVSSSLHALCVCSSPVFSCDFLSPFSPLPDKTGRGVLYLLHSFVAVLFLSSRFPHSLRSSPCLLAPRGSLSSSSFTSSSSPLLVSRRRSHLVRVSPFFRQAWARRVSARYLLAYPRSRMRFPLSCGRVGGGLLPACLSDGGRCHRRRIADGVGVGVAPCLLRMAAGDVVSAACCVLFVVSLFVYINRVLARVS